jgi:uncharacterized membrane protein YozB (DUF420 family)
MIPLSDFPAIDATLNGTSALLLTLGYFFIRRKKIQAHKLCMLSAFAASTLFLVCYIWYHAHHGVTRFPRQGAGARPLPSAARFAHNSGGGHRALGIDDATPGWRGWFERHKRIARWTLPLWFYVSVTGVVVYWMLYHLHL